MKTLKALWLVLLPLSSFGQYFDQEPYPASIPYGPEKVLFKQYNECNYGMGSCLVLSEDCITGTLRENTINVVPGLQIKLLSADAKAKSLKMTAIIATVKGIDTNDINNYFFLISSTGRLANNYCDTGNIFNEYESGGNNVRKIDLHKVVKEYLDGRAYRIIRDSLFVFKFSSKEPVAAQHLIDQDTLMPLVKIKGNGETYVRNVQAIKYLREECGFNIVRMKPFMYRWFKQFHNTRLTRKIYAYKSDTIGYFRYNKPFTVEITDHEKLSLHFGHIVVKFKNEFFDRLRLDNRLCLFNYEGRNYEPAMTANMKTPLSYRQADTITFLVYNLSSDTVAVKGFTMTELSTGIAAPALLMPGEVSAIKLGIDVTRKKLKLNKWHHFSLKVKTDKGNFSLKYSIWAYKD